MLQKIRCILLISIILLGIDAQKNYAIESSLALKPAEQQNTSQGNFNLQKIGQFIGGSEIVDVWIVDTIAYLADEKQGLLIVNITNLSTPILINSYQDNTNSIYDIIIKENFAFLAHGRGGLKIIDITDLTNLVEIASLNDGGIVWKLFLTGNYIYIVDRLNGIEIIDITNIYSPKKVGVYQGQPFDVYVRDKYAYVAAGIKKGLEIVDISDPSSPKKIGQLDLGFEDTVGVTVDGNYAYIANRENGMKIVKITRARNPKIIAEYKNIDGGKVWNIEIKNHFVYLACEAKGVQIIDITYIRQPYKIGHYFDSSGKSFNVKYYNELIFNADFEDGLEILAWKVAPPIPMRNDYVQIDSTTKNFNQSIGPYIAEAFFGNETANFNISLLLDVGLMSPVNILVNIPRKIAQGDLINLIIEITGESSFFWGHFEGTIEFKTPTGLTELFSLDEIGMSQYVKLKAFQTFIGENILMNNVLHPIKLWSQEVLDYTLSLIMISSFNITGSAIITAKINETPLMYDLKWTYDRERIIFPLEIPETINDFYVIPLENLQFEIEDLRIDLNNIRFDVLVNDLLPIYSWELNSSHFNFGGLQNKQTEFIFQPNTQNNHTLFYLDGIYPLGSFLIKIHFSGNLHLRSWAIILILLGIITIITLPLVLILVSTKRKSRDRNEKSKEVIH